MRSLMRKHLLGLKDTGREEIIEILDTAKELKPLVENPERRGNLLNKYSVLTLFYEDSTRTRVSFTMAAEYLGASVSDLAVSSSSVNKGETLVDTGINLAEMGINVMVIRHRMTGAPHLLAKAVDKYCSVVNAGDGTNEHPTQALLDLYTIREKLGGFDGIKVAIIGDVNHSRVARSNMFGLVKLGARLTLAGPSTLLSANMTRYHENVSATTNITEAVKDADVVMGLRVQLERQKAAAFPDLKEYSDLFGISPHVLSYAKKDALIMHPGPVNRGVELSGEVIDSSNSVIYEQVKNGVAVRMAILKRLIDGTEGYHGNIN